MTMLDLTAARPLTNRLIGGNDIRRILVVDDEETIRLALTKFLRGRGFEVEAAPSGMAALDMLQAARFDLKLCDVRMPEMSGVDLVSHALALDSELAVVMLTAVNDAPTATEVLSRGAMDYLMKPIELPDLQSAIERILHRRALAIEQRNVERLIREEVSIRTAQLEHEKRQLRQLSIDVVDALIKAQEAKDVHLRGHSHRVASLAASIAQEMGLDADTVEDIRIAGRLHDVGKIGIREDVLNKPGKLTEDEMAHVRDHVRIGMEILSPLRHLGQILIYVHDHHEHWDGSGYPRRLRGEQISLGGRIICAADVYDAMTSSRAYRQSMTSDAVLAHLTAHSTPLLDPSVFAALRTVVEQRNSLVFIDEK
jgi:response regulator RpfG family c-di-GMP phosphodiesterase